MHDLIDRIRRLAQAHPEPRSDLDFGPTTDADVRAVEARLGVRLPRSFRAYLLGFAGGLMFGYEIAGIQTSKSRIPAFPDPGLPDTGDYAVLDLAEVNRRRAKYFPAGLVYIC